MVQKILVVDDEENIRFTFDAFLSDAGYQVATAASLTECMKMLENERFDLLFLDILLGRDNGLEVLRRVKEIDPNCPVVMITGAPQVETAAEAVRCGAFDYIPKPVRQQELLRVAVTALEHKLVIDQKETFRLRMEAVFRCVNDGIVIFNQELQVVEINAAAQRIFGSNAAVLGKSLTELTEADCGYLKRFEQLIAARGETEIYRYELNAAADHRILSLSVTALTTLSGKEQGLVMIVRDETTVADSRV
ncbi:MAG: response regulator [Desulfuromonadales bacterium]|nr:response regulator [Desulfuromonadales bacterium]